MRQNVPAPLIVLRLLGKLQKLSRLQAMHTKLQTAKLTVSHPHRMTHSSRTSTQGIFRVGRCEAVRLPECPGISGPPLVIRCSSSPLLAGLVGFRVAGFVGSDAVRFSSFVLRSALRNSRVLCVSSAPPGNLEPSPATRCALCLLFNIFAQRGRQVSARGYCCQIVWRDLPQGRSRTAVKAEQETLRSPFGAYNLGSVAGHCSRRS